MSARQYYIGADEKVVGNKACRQVLTLRLIPEPKGPQTFSNGDYRFTYPAEYKFPTENTYDILCGGSPCVIFPESRYRGTNFVRASFSASEGELTTKAKCLDLSDLDSIATDSPKIIQGLEFVHGVVVGVATGTVTETDAYRTFHAGKCYRLEITVEITNIALYDPGTIKEFTEEDESQVRAELMEIMDSFRFKK